jgi:hypothetical protein
MGNLKRTSFSTYGTTDKDTISTHDPAIKLIAAMLPASLGLLGPV